MSITWNDVKSVIGKTAPAIATALFSPAAGGVVSGLCSIFGLTDNKATAEQVINAFSNATPEQILALKKLEADTAIQLKQMDIQIIQIDAQDRASARVRETEYAAKLGKPDITMKVLAYGISFGFFLCIYLLMSQLVDLTESDKGILCILLGQLSAKFGSIVDYYFGSSSSSRKKDETIDTLSVKK